MIEEIKHELNKQYMIELSNRLLLDANRIPESKFFRILKIADLKNIHLVILGQDPYSTGVVEEGRFKLHYDGIAFSSANTTKIPYSLRVLQDWFVNTEKMRNKSGVVSNDLAYLVNRGVLLINTLWSVSYGKPLSHAYTEWYMFTAFILELIQRYNKDVAFLLLGNEAQRMKYAIKNKNRIFETQHPASSRYKNNDHLALSNTLYECMNSLRTDISLLE